MDHGEVLDVNSNSYHNNNRKRNEPLIVDHSAVKYVLRRLNIIVFRFSMVKSQEKR